MMHLAKALLYFNQTLKQLPSPHVPVRLNPERFSNPFPLIRDVEAGIEAASNIDLEAVPSIENALSLRAALACGFLGSVIGGHRPTQVRTIVDLLVSLSLFPPLLNSLTPTTSPHTPTTRPS